MIWPTREFWDRYDEAQRARWAAWFNDCSSTRTASVGLTADDFVKAIASLEARERPLPPEMN